MESFLLFSINKCRMDQKIPTTPLPPLPSFFQKRDDPRARHGSDELFRFEISETLLCHRDDKQAPAAHTRVVVV